MLGIARQLSLRGNRVRVLGPATLADVVTPTGATFRPFTRAPEFDRTLAIEDQIGDFLSYWAGDALATELQLELAHQPADLLVIDCMLLGALAAAESTGLPTAVLVHFLYGPAVVGDWARGWEGVRGNVAEVRRKLGLAPLPSDGGTLLDQIWKRVALTLVATSSAFDDASAEVAANVRYVGPIRFDGDVTWTWDLPWPPDDPLPLVCVSLSTTNQRQEALVQRIVDAASDLKAHVLVLSGGVPAEGLHPPANAAVREWVPHPAVVPYAAAMVTHAGHGTSILTLAYGVPLVCIPMGRDQHLVSARVTACGAGVVLTQNASVEEIRRGIVAVLGEPAFRQSARVMSELIGPRHDGWAAAAAIEALSATGS
jgi:MGT family glycosyltransferase